MNSTCLETTSSGRLRLQVRVKPRSNPQGLEGVRNGRLIIRIGAPALEGRANQELVSYLAKILKIKKTQVLLSSGEKSRDKTLELTKVGFQDVSEKLGLVDDPE